MTRLNLGAAALLVFSGLFAPSAAQAAQSYDNCTGFITTIPTVITTQGTWCLKSDLATAINSGNAITINTNNVTIDCNDFKLGGLAAGAGTATLGIYASGRLNATVRHCNIRGFYYGLWLSGLTGGGHVVEDNRFDGNTLVALEVDGDGSVVRRNLVFETGGSTLTNGPYGIATDGSIDVIDNTVSGVIATASTNSFVYGIHTNHNLDAQIVGNRVRGLFKDGTGGTYGIYSLNSDRVTLRGNDIVGDANTGSVGLRCFSFGVATTTDNVINKFETANENCNDDGGNVIKP